MNKPQFISVLHRRLKDEYSYRDFYQAWLPPNVVDKDPTQEAVEYFKLPMQVINAVSSKDPTNIISICLIWGTEKELEDEILRTKSTDAERSERISQVANKNQETEFYIIKDINFLGIEL